MEAELTLPSWRSLGFSSGRDASSACIHIRLASATQESCEAGSHYSPAARHLPTKEGRLAPDARLRRAKVFPALVVCARRRPGGTCSGTPQAHSTTNVAADEVRIDVAARPERHANGNAPAGMKVRQADDKVDTQKLRGLVELIDRGLVAPLSARFRCDKALSGGGVEPLHRQLQGANRRRYCVRVIRSVPNVLTTDASHHLIAFMGSRPSQRNSRRVKIWQHSNSVTSAQPRSQTQRGAQV